MFAGAPMKAPPGLVIGPSIVGLGVCAAPVPMKQATSARTAGMWVRMDMEPPTSVDIVETTDRQVQSGESPERVTPT